MGLIARKPVVNASRRVRSSHSWSTRCGRPFDEYSGSDMLRYLDCESFLHVFTRLIGIFDMKSYGQVITGEQSASSDKDMKTAPT